MYNTHHFKAVLHTNRLKVDADYIQGVPELDFFPEISEQNAANSRHATPLGHIILIPCQPVFPLNPFKMCA